MKTLHLPLKAKWYKMIESGVKTEEYRELKEYWVKRLTRVNRHGYIEFANYTHVKFYYGYTMRTMTFKIKSITIGAGNQDWGAPREDVFIIKLGERL